MRKLRFTLGLATLLFFFFHSTTWAQGVTDASTTAEQTAPSEKSAPTYATSDGESARLVIISSEFDELRIWAWIVMLGAAIMGLATYYYMHKRIMEYDSVSGLATTLISAPILFWLVLIFVLTIGSSCLHMDLAAGASALPFDHICRAGREHAANALGLRWLWSVLSSQQVTEGALVAIAPGVIKVIMYLSSVIGSGALYLLFKPLVKGLTNRSR